MSKLLLVDDDTEVLSLNKQYFQKMGYEVKIATNAKSGFHIIKNFNPDCIVLDVMMPGIDGFQAARKIVELTNAPFIFLTGKASKIEKLKGFHLGADDYLVKPYSLQELSARINVILRRYHHLVSSTTIKYSPLSIDLVHHKAFYNQEQIPLSNREYELLFHLVSNPNTTLTFEDLGKLLWGTYTNSDRRSIMVIVSRLRKKLEAYIGLSNFITTLWSEGYQFTPK